MQRAETHLIALPCRTLKARRISEPLKRAKALLRASGRDKSGLDIYDKCFSRCMLGGKGGGECVETLMTLAGKIKGAHANVDVSVCFLNMQSNFLQHSEKSPKECKQCVYSAWFGSITRLRSCLIKIKRRTTRSLFLIYHISHTTGAQFDYFWSLDYYHSCNLSPATQHRIVWTLLPYFFHSWSRDNGGENSVKDCSRSLKL